MRIVQLIIVPKRAYTIVTARRAMRSGRMAGPAAAARPG
jgi:hypothetical protein